MNDIMRIAICENDQWDAEQLKEMLARYLKANRVEADVDLYGSGEEFLEAFAPKKYHIVFMDIYMKEDGMTGMDAAAKATAADRGVVVVFISSSEAHLQEGYNYAVYYIVKPYDGAMLDAAMKKCRAQIEKYAKTIDIPVNRQSIPIRLRDIYSVESIKHSCVFKLNTHEITVTKMRFEGLIDQLDGFPFHRCHRSYIVNLSHVKQLAENDFIMENDNIVPIGRNYIPESRKACKLFFWKLLQGEL